MKAGAYSLAVAIILVVCTTASPSGLEYHAPYKNSFGEITAALDRAEAQWAAADVTNYSLRIRRFSAFGGSVFMVTYWDGSCRARHLQDVGHSTPFECEKNSMSQLFAEVRRAIRSGVSSVALSLDPELGYIHRFSIHGRLLATDQGGGAEITDLKVLKSPPPIMEPPSSPPWIVESPPPITRYADVLSPDGAVKASAFEYGNEKRGFTQVTLQFLGYFCSSEAAAAYRSGLRLELRWIDNDNLEILHPSGVEFDRHTLGDVVGCNGRKVRIRLVARAE